jgi:hypothetical protein
MNRILITRPNCTAKISYYGYGVQTENNSLYQLHVSSLSCGKWSHILTFEPHACMR